MPGRATIPVATMLLVLAACGNDDNGNEDTLFTGFSGVIILAIAIWLIVRARRKRT